MLDETQNDTLDARKEAANQWRPIFEKAGNETKEDAVRAMLRFNWEKMMNAGTVKRMDEIANFALNGTKVVIADTVITGK